MIDDLYRFYERELTYFRQLAQEFAKKYPAAAGRLLLEPNRSADPHVERLIEAFAFLTARVHNKLNDEYPELTDALLTILYPHYLAPIPSMAIVQFDLDSERSSLPDGFTISRFSHLKSPPVQDLKCRFRTSYETKLWPIKVTMAKIQTPPFPQGIQALPQTAAVLRLQLEMMGDLNFHQLSIDRLRFYLNGESNVITDLYELIFNHAQQVVFRTLERDQANPEPLVFKPEQVLAQVGFEPNQDLLPYPNHSFIGYRLLTEFFCFPAKFWFMDLLGWQRVIKAGWQRRIEVDIYLNRTLTSVEQAVDVQAFRLGCTPIVNLFEQTAEPINLTQRKSEYRVVPDVAHPNGLEVHSILEVVSANPENPRQYHPFYSFTHLHQNQGPQTFWMMTREKSMVAGDRGTDVYMQFVDLQFNPRLPAEEVLVVRTLCSNRDLPAKLQQLSENLTFELEMAAPLQRIRCLRMPTISLRPVSKRGQHWRLISHLTLNHLSIMDDQGGRDALREMLRLYDFSDSEAGQHQSNVTRQIIDGILAVQHRRIVGRVHGGFARGVEILMEFDEAKYVGSGVYLFASILERFLGLYASINSFTQLTIRTRQREGILKKWPPRAGLTPLV